MEFAKFALKTFRCKLWVDFSCQYTVRVTAAMGTGDNWQTCQSCFILCAAMVDANSAQWNSFPAWVMFIVWAFTLYGMRTKHSETHSTYVLYCARTIYNNLGLRVILFRKCKNKSRKITQLCVICLCACTTVYLKQMPTEVWWWKRQLQKYTIWKCVIRHRAEAGANVDTNIGTTTSVHDMFKTSVKMLTTEWRPGVYLKLDSEKWIVQLKMDLPSWH